MLVDVNDSMRVLTEETFGPLLPVIKVRDAEEAIANASSYGLSGSVWTTDRARGLAVAKRLETGTVLLNDALAVVGMADVPYGGVKSSGVGRMHGREGLEDCVKSTPIVDDLFPTWHQPWWFGYGPAHLERVRAYQRFAHGGSIGERERARWHARPRLREEGAPLMRALIALLDILLDVVRSGSAALLAIGAVLAALAWAVRARKVNPFGGLARFTRRAVEPILTPVDRRLARHGIIGQRAVVGPAAAAHGLRHAHLPGRLRP